MQLFSAALFTLLVAGVIGMPCEEVAIDSTYGSTPIILQPTPYSYGIDPRINEAGYLADEPLSEGYPLPDEGLLGEGDGIISYDPHLPEY